jgi:hypothetical protein
MNLDLTLKAFERPDERREFEMGCFEIVHVGGMTIGRATDQPGWKWSDHVGLGLGQKFCEVEHVGMVVSGAATAAFCRWPRHRVARRGSLSHPANFPRQLGRGKRTIHFDPFPRRGSLRQGLTQRS